MLITTYITLKYISIITPSLPLSLSPQFSILDNTTFPLDNPQISPTHPQPSSHIPQPARRSSSTTLSASPNRTESLRISIPAPWLKYVSYMQGLWDFCVVISFECIPSIQTPPPLSDTHPSLPATQSAGMNVIFYIMAIISLYRSALSIYLPICIGWPFLVVAIGYTGTAFSFLKTKWKDLWQSGFPAFDGNTFVLQEIYKVLPTDFKVSHESY